MNNSESSVRNRSKTNPLKVETTQKTPKTGEKSPRRFRNLETMGTKDEVDLDLEEPMTPVGRMFSEEKMNCYILTIITLGKPIDADIIKSGLSETLAKHKRFRSRVVRNQRTGSLRWSPCKVDIDKHVTIVADSHATKTPEEYAETLANAPPLDADRPLWQVHLLMNCSAAVFRIHHSLGDGVSLMSLLLACTRKSDDPESLPSIPQQVVRRGYGIWAQIWVFFLVMWYTVCDVLAAVCTFLWLKDSETVIKGAAGVEKSGARIVHRSFPLSDVKIVKGTVNNGTINDVFIAMLSAGISTYLQNYEKGEQNNQKASSKRGLLRNLRLRSTVLVNTRPSPGLHDVSEMMSDGKISKARWGNSLGYVLLPFPIKKYEDPLHYMKHAKVLSRKKKLSLEAPFSHASGRLIMKFAGVKVITELCYRMIANTTFSFSNIAGPTELVEFFGHPITNFLPTVCGHPHAMTVHFQSYAGNVTLVMKVAKDVISDPEVLLQDCIQALYDMKNAALSSHNSSHPSTSVI